jgi:hypothetical protein
MNFILLSFIYEVKNLHFTKLKIETLKNENNSKKRAISPKAQLFDLN